MSSPISQADIYADFNGLAQLKVKAGGNNSEQQDALGEVARQFETIFLKMMLKSMRDTVPESDLINNDKARFYESMYDDQISLDLSKRGDLGLAQMIVNQMGESGASKTNKTLAGLASYRQTAIQQKVPHASNEQVELPRVIADTQPLSTGIQSIEDFAKTLGAAASNAAKELGVDTKVLLAQSALETGWGKHIMKDQTGRSSYNMFGIKASHGWQGKTVNVQTVEYEQGVAQKRQATFRAYDSYEESFNDYVQFLKQNPRYSETLSKVDSNEAFVKGLQKAGYATDPAYAKKIMSILGREQLSSIETIPSVNLTQADTRLMGG